MDRYVTGEYRDHRDIGSWEETWRVFPRPWRLGEDDGEIVAANGEAVVVTDSGFYPPGRFVAQLICDAVNGWKVEKRDDQG